MFRVLVTGGRGFLGHHLIPMLQALPEVKDVIAPTSRDLSLTMDHNKIISSFKKIAPDIVIHCAAKCGGIGANRKYPYDFYTENARMNLNVLDAMVRVHSILRGIVVNSVCAYPRDVEMPMREEDLWNGPIETTNAGYGYAKKSALIQAEMANRQHGTAISNLMFTNLYGEWDNFDSESSHVIPSVIRKVSNAMKNGEDSITCWGDGSATRDLLYAGDAAQAIINCMQVFDPPIEPINVGTGQAHSIKDIVSFVCNLYGYDGNINWDTTKPNGQPERRLDISRARKLINFSPNTSLRNGIEKTIKFYKEFYGE